MTTPTPAELREKIAAAVREACQRFAQADTQRLPFGERVAALKQDGDDAASVIVALFPSEPVVAEGWRLVPDIPTPEMLKASCQALTDYIESLPEDERKRRVGKNGYRVSPEKKATVRYVAMLAAAPPPAASGGE